MEQPTQEAEPSGDGDPHGGKADTVVETEQREELRAPVHQRIPQIEVVEHHREQEETGATDRADEQAGQ